jgi:ATP-dependent Clp protease ATP-binding subunit ClpB|tara:strand:+ start:417 stop:605 length:189 start_codon:yes stop_codon:yes gene_type:complete
VLFVTKIIENKRVIQKNVINALSKSILSGSIDTSKNVILDIFDDQIVFRKPINEEEEVVIAI